MPIEGFEPYRPEDAERYDKYRWWLGLTWGDLFDKATDIYPEKEGLADDTARFTYGELRRKVDRLALGFIDLGIRERDFVLLQIPNWHEYVITFFALQKVGAITVLLISRHGPAEIAHVCGLTHPVAWIGPDRYRNTDYLAMIGRIRQEEKQLRHIVTVRAGEHAGAIRLSSLMETGGQAPVSDERLAGRGARTPTRYR